ncbi:MAG: factor-independent urate hydroxylase [Tepidisphaeraceae bacterium]
MTFELTQNSYGKSEVRLTKIVREGALHRVFEITAAIQLEGAFEAAYTEGDNRSVIATDTIKNTVYVVGKESDFKTIEELATLLCRHFLKTYAHVSAVKVELSQANWQRIVVDGRPHDHAFTNGGTHRRICRAVMDRANAAPTLQGGIHELRVLKSTASEWQNFHSDRYRTLKDTAERILASKINATWTYNTPAPDGDAAFEAVAEAMLRVFATMHSRGAQETLLGMGRAALEACPSIDSIHLELPNLHHIPFNLEPFGLKFENDIYVGTSDPYGLITGTVSRGNL